jgi:hypothetical protein
MSTHPAQGWGQCRCGAAPTTMPLSPGGPARPRAITITHGPTLAPPLNPNLDPNLARQAPTDPQPTPNRRPGRWEMLTGQRPYAELLASARDKRARDKTILARVAHEGMRPEFPLGSPPEYARLAQACWAADFASRPTFPEVG